MNTQNSGVAPDLCNCLRTSGPFETMTDDCPVHDTKGGFTTPEALKAEALELGSTMAYAAAEYIESLHKLYAKALVEIAELRGSA